MKVYGKIIGLGVCLHGRLLPSILLRMGNFRADVCFRYGGTEVARVRFLSGLPVPVCCGFRKN